MRYLIERRLTSMVDGTEQSTYHGCGGGDTTFENGETALSYLKGDFAADLVKQHRNCLVVDVDNTGLRYTNCSKSVKVQFFLLKVEDIVAART